MGFSGAWVGGELRDRPVVWLLIGGSAALLFSATGFARLRALAAIGSPGRRAMAHWLPLAIALAVYSLLGRGDVAVGVVFGTSVLAMTAAVGFIVAPRPMCAGDTSGWPASAWALLSLVALIGFAPGLRGSLAWYDALLLATQGLIFNYLFGQSDDDQPRADPLVQALSTEAANSQSLPRANRWMGALELLAVATFAALGAWATARALAGGGAAGVPLSAGAVAAGLLSIALAMPLASSGAAMALKDRSAAALSGNAGYVVLNLCAGLPLIFLLSALRHWWFDPWTPWHGAGSAMEWLRSRQLASLANYEAAIPRAVWRVDALALVVATLAIAPIAIGRWRLERWMGAALIFGYAIYLIATMTISAAG